jgi:hypothetical protein
MNRRLLTTPTALPNRRQRIRHALSGFLPGVYRGWTIRQSHSNLSAGDSLYRHQASIHFARVYSAAWVLRLVCLGLLANESPGKKDGLLVAVIAIFTPWLFDVSRFMMETFFILRRWRFCWRFTLPEKGGMGLVKHRFVAGALMLITYSYTIGRL